MIGYNLNIHKRKSIRLKGYDYSQAGLYFITIATQNRKNLFGKIQTGKMILNDAGKTIETEWIKLPQRFTNIKLHEYVIMPNHFHAIFEIWPVGATLVVALNNVVAQNNNSPTQQNDNIAPNDVTTKNNVSTTPNNVAAPNNNYNPKFGQLPMGQQTEQSTEQSTEQLQKEQTITAHPTGQPQGIAPTTGKTVGDMIGVFKSITTVEYIRGVKTKNWEPFNGKLWQRNYWERIIRNKNEYNRISQYIINNPIKWENDKLNGGMGNIIMESKARYGEEIWMV